MFQFIYNSIYNTLYGPCQIPTSMTLKGLQLRCEGIYCDKVDYVKCKFIKNVWNCYNNNYAIFQYSIKCPECYNPDYCSISYFVNPPEFQIEVFILIFSVFFIYIAGCLVFEHYII